MASQSGVTTNKNKEFTEAELCDLLDSTVDDFCRKEESLNTPATEQQENSTPSKPQSSKPRTPNNTPNFKAPTTNDLGALFESDPQLKDNFAKIIKSCNDESANFDDLDFQKSLEQTIKLISEKAKELSENEPLPENDEFMNTLKNLEEFQTNNPNMFDDPEGRGTGNLMPIMSDIMENLLSKEFLYPTLTDLHKKYPDYLEANKGKIPEEEFERYTKQYDIIQRIVEEFELESPEDSADVKTARFQQILQHMQTMQSYGSPPTDLVGPGDSPFARPGGLPDLSSLDQGGCCLM